MARLQLSQIVHRKRAIILFEGWMGAGKKAVLKRLVGALDPTHVRVISVAGSDEADDDRHWLAPFWSRLPAAGDTTIFYRSWYRLIVEQRVLGSLDDKRWARAIDEINEFEAQQRDHGTMIAKLFFHVTRRKAGGEPAGAAGRPVAAAPARSSADHRAGQSRPGPRRAAGLVRPHQHALGAVDGDRRQ